MPSTRVNGSPSTTIRSANVPESPRRGCRARTSARLGCQHGLPLPAGREPAPPRPRAGVGDLLTTSAGESESAWRRPPAAVRLVVADRGPVDDPDPAEGHPALGGQPRVLVDHADPGRRTADRTPRRPRVSCWRSRCVRAVSSSTSGPSRACRATRCGPPAPADSKAAATSSAPTDTAAARRLTNTRALIASPGSGRPAGRPRSPWRRPSTVPTVRAVGAVPRQKTS